MSGKKKKTGKMTAAKEARNTKEQVNEALNAESGEAQQGKEKETNLKAEIISWVEVIAIAVALALFINSFIIINANVPSGSMEKTIMTGDRVLGLRFSYWFNDPQRGDIVVFKYPVEYAQIQEMSFFERLGYRLSGKSTENYIKRIIGLPGETVEIKDGAVYIDGEKLEEDYINGTWTVVNDGLTFEVPEDHYLMLGDNRNNSSDARYWPLIAKKEGLTSDDEEAMTYAYVPRKHILGKAYLRYWPFSSFGTLYK